jgi:tetratricopeptide (TPR) repeat protein
MGNRIVEFSRGSKFYYELGNYYYYKNNLDRALAYYQRALAVDPANPVNYFNVACLLSELGKYRESISLFKKVTEMDSSISESWFWLAMNHGQLRQYKEACRYLRKYLEQEPEGDYSWQAEEILEYLRSDLPMLSPRQRMMIDCLCTSGIDLVSQGRLQEAVKCFARASAIEPEMAAPKNNLALSWFYLGDMGKALELTWEILDSEPNNVFANCNLCTFYFILNDQLSLRRQVRVLDTLWSDDPDEMLKLGTTYGLLGLDRKALDAFRHLHGLGYRSFELLLLLGIAYFNCKYFSQAAKVFERVNALEPDNPYGIYRILCTDPPGIKLPYHLQVPQQAIAGILGTESVEAHLQELKSSPDLWPQLIWLVRHGNASARKTILETIGALRHLPLTEQVAALVWDESMDSHGRRTIYAHLVRQGFPVLEERFWNRGRFSHNRARVLAGALADLAQAGHDYDVLYSAYTAWSVFCRRKNKRIRDVELWRAALFLMVSGLDQLEAVAGKFALAPVRLRRAVAEFSFFTL